MTFYTRNTGRPWTVADDLLLRRLVQQNTPTRVIGLKMGRTEAAIYSRAAFLGRDRRAPVLMSPTPPALGGSVQAGSPARERR